MILIRENSPFGHARHVEHVEQLAPNDAKIIGNILGSPPIKFINNDLFKIPNARNHLFCGKNLLDFDFEAAELDWHHFFARSWTTSNNGFAIRQKNSTSAKHHLFTLVQEKIAFIQYNYARFRVHNYQIQNEKKVLSDAKKRDLLYWHRLIESHAEIIIIANLGLVLAMVRNRKIELNLISCSDLVADGKMALLRATDLFDISRGFRFSTYACRAINQQITRSVGLVAKEKRLIPISLNEHLWADPRVSIDDSPEKNMIKEQLREKLGQKIVQANLSRVEKRILALRFPLHANLGKKRLSLMDVSKVIGLTKERVRQIQIIALDKMRKIMEDEYYAEAI